MLAVIPSLVTAALVSVAVGWLFGRGDSDAVESVIARNAWLENRLAASDLAGRSLVAVAIIIGCGLAVSLYEILRSRKGGANAKP